MSVTVNFSRYSHVEKTKRGYYTAVISDAVACVFNRFNIDETIVCNFVSGSYIKELNKNYRNKNKVTDVLSFSYFEEKYKEGFLFNKDFDELKNQAFVFAEMYLCNKAIFENSILNNENFYNELFRVAVHSSLHLLGFDHPEGQSIESMLKNRVKMIELQEKIVSQKRKK